MPVSMNLSTSVRAEERKAYEAEARARTQQSKAEQEAAEEEAKVTAGLLACLPRERALGSVRWLSNTNNPLFICCSEHRRRSCGGCG